MKVFKQKHCLALILMFALVMFFFLGAGSRIIEGFNEHHNPLHLLRKTLHKINNFKPKIINGIERHNLKTSVNLYKQADELENTIHKMIQDYNSGGSGHSGHNRHNRNRYNNGYGNNSNEYGGNYGNSGGSMMNDASDFIDRGVSDVENVGHSIASGISNTVNDAVGGLENLF